jgi:phage shock protein A
MAMVRSVSASLRARIHRVLDRFDDPQAAVDYARERQLSLLAAAHGRLARLQDEIAGSELDELHQRECADQWDRRAQEQLATDGEASARAALAERAGALTRIKQLSRSRDALLSERERLGELVIQVEQRMNEFRTLSETIRAAGVAARTQKVLADIAADNDELRGAVARTNARAEQLWARGRTSRVDPASGAPPPVDHSATSADRRMRRVRRPGRRRNSAS